MRPIELFEAIDTAAIDRAARKALAHRLREFMNGEHKHLVSIYGEQEDRSELYDMWHQRVARDDNTATLFVQSVCHHASDALNTIVQDALRREYPLGEVIIKAPQGLDYRVPIKGIDVKIEVREHSEDEHRDYGGYFQGGFITPKIRCFVAKQDVQVASWGTMQEVMFGEGEDTDLLTRLLVPIFVHEFTHLLQFLRGGSATDSDLGYITVHGGKRGGRRDPSNRRGTTPDNRSAWLRYKSSAKEIESFAADAASSIAAEIENRRGYYEDRRAEDEEIRRVLRDIAEGYDGVESVSRYREITWQAMQGEFDDLGVPPHEVRRVWKRYLKLVYRKLWSYSQGRMGRSPDDQFNRKYPEHWRKAAQKGISHASAFIANEVAMERDGNRRHDLTSKGSAFLERYFFGEEYGYDFEQSMKVTRAFNRLVDKAIDAQNSFGA